MPPESSAAEAVAAGRFRARGRVARLRDVWSLGRALAMRPEFVVTLFTALHLGVSFVNQLVLAYLFGVSAEMDAFLAAGALPLAVLGLVIGELGFVLVPLLTHYREKGEDLGEFSSRVFSLLAVAGLGISLLGLVACGWILRLTTSAEIPPATLELAIRLAPWVWLLVGLNFLSSFFVGLYHFHRRFSLPAVVLVFPYLGMIAAGLLWAPTLGIRSVAYGWLAGTLLKTVILAAGIWRASGLRWCWPFGHRAGQELGLSLLPLGVALLPFTVLPVLDAYWASGLAHGSLAAVSYASRIAMGMTTIVVQGIAVVLFPAIADDGVAGKQEEFRRKVAGAVRSILLLILPAAALIIALRLPLLELLFERGRFDRADTLAVASVLPWYLVGMVAMAPMNVISRGFFARRDYKTPAKLGLVSLALYGVLCALLTPSFSYVGIAIAYAVFWPLTFLLQAYWLGRAVGRLLERSLWRLLVEGSASALLAAGLAAGLVAWLPSRLGDLGGLVVSGLAGLAVFVGLACFVFRLVRRPGPAPTEGEQ